MKRTVIQRQDLQQLLTSERLATPLYTPIDISRESYGQCLQACLAICFCQRIPTVDLLHQRQKIADAPVVGNLAVLESRDVDRLEMNLATSWSDS